MTQSSPLVSIGMPVRNSAATLATCINSLLLQTHSDWEALLIDDGSSDNTVEIARSYKDCRIKVISDGRSLGVRARLNQAVRAASGQFFARMDSDDVAYPERLERQLAYLALHPDVTLVGSWVIVFGKHGEALGKRAGPEDHAHITAHPYSGFPIPHPSFLAGIDYFRKYPYPRGAVRTEDQILLLSTFRKVRFANVPQVLLGYREETLNLRKILVGRYAFATNAATDLRHRGQHVRAGKVVAEQLIKGVIDTLAVTSGLDYRLLRHRATPASAAELQKWREVWTKANGSSRRTPSR